MSNLVELAKLFKERENQSHMGIQIGKVISEMPDVKISINGKIILTKDHLIFSSQLLKDYARAFEINTKDPILHNDNLTNTSFKGTLKWTDEIKIGDEILLIPTQDEQLFYAADVVRRLE